MLAMQLIDSNLTGVNYGILLCSKEGVTKQDIQDKIMEIKGIYEAINYDWYVRELIADFPEDWGVTLLDNSYVTI